MTNKRTRTNDQERQTTGAREAQRRDSRLHIAHIHPLLHNNLLLLLRGAVLLILLLLLLLLAPLLLLLLPLLLLLLQLQLRLLERRGGRVLALPRRGRLRAGAYGRRGRGRGPVLLLLLLLCVRVRSGGRGGRRVPRRVGGLGVHEALVLPRGEQREPRRAVVARVLVVVP